MCLFRFKEEALSILKGLWFLDSSFLCLKPYHSLFDVKEEFMTKMHI